MLLGNKGLQTHFHFIKNLIKAIYDYSEGES